MRCKEHPEALSQGEMRSEEVESGVAALGTVVEFVAQQRRGRGGALDARNGRLSLGSVGGPCGRAGGAGEALGGWGRRRGGRKRTDCRASQTRMKTEEYRASLHFPLACSPSGWV